MRIWVKPTVLARLGITVPELVRAVQQQSTVNPAGQVGAQPAPPGQEMTYTVRAQGRLQTPEEFGAIAVRANPDGSVVRLKDVARDRARRAQLPADRAASTACPDARSASFRCPDRTRSTSPPAMKKTMADMAQRFPAGPEVRLSDRHDARRDGRACGKS